MDQCFAKVISVSKFCFFMSKFFRFMQLLKHHVMPGRVPAAALTNNLVAQSLAKTPLRVKHYEPEDRQWKSQKVLKNEAL